jgi:hypothetical protein
MWREIQKVFWCENIRYNFLHTPAWFFGAVHWWYFNVGGFSIKINCFAYCLLCGMSIEHKKCHLRELSFICIFMAEHRNNESWKCCGCSEWRKSHCSEHWCSASFSIFHNEGWIRGELWFQVVFYVLFHMFVVCVPLHLHCTCCILNDIELMSWRILFCEMWCIVA